MTTTDFAHYRLHNQQISQHPFQKPGDVVRWLGAIQAQDYLGALWAIGSRVSEVTERAVEQAIADKTIVRTWPMRGTLHFVAPEDARWMQALLTPKVISGSAGRYRQLELNEAVFGRSQDLLIKALEGGKQLTRNELYAVLERGSVSASAQRGLHIIGHFAQKSLLCFGPRRDKQPTFTLLDEWIPGTVARERSEALAELARRYFSSHGPATLQDFVWWTGLSMTDAKLGIELAKAHLIQETVEGKSYWMPPTMPPLKETFPTVYLLASYEEYLLGYKDRSAVLDTIHNSKVVPGGNGVFSPIIVIDGKVAGTWKRTMKKDTVAIEINPFAALNKDQTLAIEVAAVRYSKFLEMKLVI
jgi:hypothetical protein